MQAVAAMIKLNQLDQGERLDKVNIGLSADVTKMLMHRGVRSVVSLHEVATSEPEHFAAEYKISEPELRQLLKVLANACGDFLMDPDHREMLLSLDFPIDEGVDDLESDFEVGASSKEDLISSENFSESVELMRA